MDALVVQHDDLRALRVAESSRARVLAERLGRDLKTEPFPTRPAALVRPRVERVDSVVLDRPAAVVRVACYRRRGEALRLAAGSRNRDARHGLPPAWWSIRLPTRFRIRSARALWDKVMAPIAAEIPDGSRVIVIPDGPLHRLNLETLVAPGPQPHYWIEDAEIAVSPSMTDRHVEGRRIAAPNGSVLVIGAPEYAGTGYDPLPGAASEVQQLRTRFANVAPAVFTGTQASPGVYRAAGSGEVLRHPLRGARRGECHEAAGIRRRALARPAIPSNYTRATSSTFRSTPTW